MIVFDVPWHVVLTLVGGTAIPLLVGLVTTRVTDSGKQATLLVLFSVVANLLAELAAALQSGEPYNLGMALLAAVGTFIVGVSTHYGLWKPTGVTEKVLDTGRTPKHL